MYIKLDRKTGSLSFELPPPLAEYRQAAEAAVSDEFAFEPLNKATLVRMNNFLREWFGNQGINLPDEPDMAPDNSTGKGE